MRWWTLLLLGCGPEEGQKVRALLFDHTIDCVSVADEHVAILQLDQPQDYYLAERRDAEGAYHGLSTRREGRMVTFPCPDGVDRITVRTATVLNATTSGRRGDAPDEPTGPVPP